MTDTPHPDQTANEQDDDMPTDISEQAPLEEQLTEDLSVQGGE